MKTVASAHPTKKISIWFQDEARIGNKGRVCHRWFTKGKRPSGIADNRFTYAYIFAAVKPGTNDGFAWIMPHANKQSMQIFLDEFAKEIPDDEHIMMVMDGAGWHDSRALNVPANITLVVLPPYSPELNPVERVWLYLKQKYLSHRLLDDYDALLDAACNAWNALASQPDRLLTLASYDWILEVNP